MIAQSQPDAGGIVAAPTTPVTEFERLVRQHQDEILASVTWMIRSAGIDDDPEDLFQEIMLKAWRHRHQFRGRSSWLTWVTSIARNEVRLSIRRLSQHRWVPFAPVGDPPLRPDEIALARATVEKLAPILDRLTQAEQDALVLWSEGRLDELRDRSGSPLSRTARKFRAYRARIRIRQIYERSGSASD